MGRRQLTIALGCVVLLTAFANERVAADSLLNLARGLPDIASDNIQITYDASSHAFSAVGFVENLSGSTVGLDVVNDNFYLNALIDNTGHLASATLNVFFGGEVFFTSSAPVNFGFGTGVNEVIQFTFTQGATQSGPAAGTLIGVELHTSTAFSGFGNSYLPNDPVGSTSRTVSEFATVSDTFVVESSPVPLPKPALLGMVLFSALGVCQLIRARYRAGALPET